MSNLTLVNDGRSIINSIKFDTKATYDLTYYDIFNTYKNEDNLLFTYNKIIQAPIIENQKNKFVKFQILATLLSKVSENKNYQEVIGKFERKKKNYLST